MKNEEGSLLRRNRKGKRFFRCIQIALLPFDSMGGQSAQ